MQVAFVNGAAEGLGMTVLLLSFRRQARDHQGSEANCLRKGLHSVSFPVMQKLFVLALALIEIPHVSGSIDYVLKDFLRPQRAVI
jgi:hypothetical protein